MAWQMKFWRLDTGSFVTHPHHFISETTDSASSLFFNIHIITVSVIMAGHLDNTALW